jgi:hypothetical protein
MNCVILAGKKALDHIRENGLQPEHVKTVAGAAGGPKWLVLNHLDRFLFFEWFKDRRPPLFLAGSSIGAWRFAALSQDEPLQAFERFQDAYLHQHYNPNPSPEEVTRECRRIMDAFVADTGIRAILTHPVLRLNILTVRAKGLTASDQRAILMTGLIGAYILNTISRYCLGRFFERALFYNVADRPPFLNTDKSPVQRTALTLDNFRQALLASGSIPLVMSGVRRIPGAKAGVYRDGGVIDYHLNLPWDAAQGEIVLFPHYLDRIVPGWLDKNIHWRKPVGAYLDHVLLVAPSSSFVKKLPRGRIPDRNDFYEFAGKDAARIAVWREVIAQSRRMADEFKNLVETGKIREVVQPIA